MEGPEEMAGMGDIKQFVIVTGMSGAGKTTALKVLEDLGFFAIDNIPPGLLPQLFTLLTGHRAAVRTGVAATIDIRNVERPGDFLKVVDDIQSVMPRTSPTWPGRTIPGSCRIERGRCPRPTTSARRAG